MCWMSFTDLIEKYRFLLNEYWASSKHCDVIIFNNYIMYLTFMSYGVLFIARDDKKY